jgi:colanic acid biosynthesis glycosyl transferase WcaI
MLTEAPWVAGPAQRAWTKGSGTGLRILLHGINYSPELTGIGKYSGEMAEWLAAQGHHVRVVTAPPYYPAWQVRKDYKAWSYRLERGADGGARHRADDGAQYSAVRVYRCPLFVPRSPSSWSRLLHLLSFTASSLPIMLAQVFWRPDVVLTVEPALFCAPATLLTAWLSRAASWLHVQDFEVDAAFDLGFLPRKGVIHNLAERLEQFFMRHFTGVSTVSLSMLRRLPAKGVPAEKTVLFPNWVDVDSIAPLNGNNAFREQLGLGRDKTVLLYTGNMGMKQGLEILPELAQRLIREERLHFLFCGDGAFRPQLEALLAGLPNVSLLPLQPLSRLCELLSAADIHLLPQRSDAADLVMPSKLTGMLASGRPVIATAAAGTQVAIAIDGCGIAVEPGDTAGVVAAIRRLAASPQERASMGAAARRHAVEFMSKEAVLRRFEAQLCSAIKVAALP